MSELGICTTCFDLHGPYAGWDNPCRCVLADDEARGVRHPRFGDLTRSAQLCQCCTFEVLPSGSKWSVWFCADCRAEIDERNRAAGRCVVPIGRHSILNGLSLDGGISPTDAAIEAFADEVSDLFARMDRLDAWARRRTRDHLARLDLLGPPVVPVATYLDAAEAAGLSRHDAVIDLWEYLSPQ